jgi:hypothetical protein
MKNLPNSLSVRSLSVAVQKWATAVPRIDTGIGLNDTTFAQSCFGLHRLPATLQRCPLFVAAKRLMGLPPVPSIFLET